eukprot:Hpha_TRINITY_DN13331_c0_g3::TRINITY_DN13331_c0_g3_i1::g.95239::m.95239
MPTELPVAASSTGPVIVILDKIRQGVRWHQIRELLPVDTSLAGSPVLKFSLIESPEGVTAEVHVTDRETGMDIERRFREVKVCKTIEIVDAPAPSTVCNFWCPICEITVNGPGPLEQLQETHGRGSRHLRCARLGAPSARGARPRGPELVQSLQEGTVAAASAFEAAAAFPEELVLEDENSVSGNDRTVQTLRSISTGRRWPAHNWKNAVLCVLRARGICRFDYFEGTCRSGAACDLRHVQSVPTVQTVNIPQAVPRAVLATQHPGDSPNAPAPNAPVMQVLTATAVASQPAVATPIGQQPVMNVPGVPLVPPAAQPIQPVYVGNAVQQVQQAPPNPWGQVVFYGMSPATCAGFVPPSA